MRWLNLVFAFLFLSLSLGHSDAIYANPTCDDRYPLHTWTEFTKPEEHLRGFRRPDFPFDSWDINGDQISTLDAKQPSQLITYCEFDYFALYFEWYVTTLGNGGIKYQVTESLGAIGLEYQVVDPYSSESTQSSLHASAALYDILAPEFDQWTYASGHWNSGVIVVRPELIEHWINGRKVLAFDFQDPTYMSGLEKSKFASRPQFRAHHQGHILLQHHGERVSYRNLKIKRLR